MTNKSELVRRLKQTSGLNQRLIGAATEIQIVAFLDPLNESSREVIEQAVARLHGIENPSRFRKQTMLLLANIFNWGVQLGAPGKRKPRAGRPS